MHLAQDSYCIMLYEYIIVLLLVSIWHALEYEKKSNG